VAKEIILKFTEEDAEEIFELLERLMEQKNGEPDDDEED
jgi:hypothetical protein